MDFIARAGRMIDGTHRMVGFLFIVIVIQTVLLFYFMGTNRDVNDQFTRYRDEPKVYVVPGSRAGLYGPAKTDFLLETFVDHVTQSYMTYTYRTIAAQLDEIKTFFTPNMLSVANKQFPDLVNTVMADERSSMFIPNRKTYEVEPTGRKNAYGDNELRVSLEGMLNYFIGGGLVETVPLRISLVVQPTNISKVNPFGFVMASYKEEMLK